MTQRVGRTTVPKSLPDTRFVWDCCPADARIAHEISIDGPEFGDKLSASAVSPDIPEQSAW